MRLLISLIAILFSATLSRDSGAQDAKPPVMFQEIGPIKDADPAQRQVKVLGVPTSLIIEAKPAGTYVGFDQQSVCELKLMVGRKMVVGVEWTLYYYRGTERVELRRETGGSLESLTSGGQQVVQGLQGIADVQGSLQLIAELSVFETDIPPQHMWMPQKGRYQVLWRGVATGTLTAK
jgi:hypothetical protein